MMTAKRAETSGFRIIFWILTGQSCGEIIKISLKMNILGEMINLELLKTSAFCLKEVRVLIKINGKNGAILSIILVGVLQGIWCVTHRIHFAVWILWGIMKKGFGRKNGIRLKTFQGFGFLEG
jgi:hypothetical protein